MVIVSLESEIYINASCFALLRNNMTVTINLRPDEERKLREISQREGLPMSYFLRKGMILFLKNFEVTDGTSL